MELVRLLLLALLYGALAWRIAALRSGLWVPFGIACAAVALFGHANLWRWSRNRPKDGPPPLLWIAAYFAAVLAIVVVLGRPS